ncbi:MAG TPA: hypothetical protein ACFYD9_10980 [Candidatus Wunengus sp. YC64]|uniref:hypothetical protein n=1 Tax=Candidatus Wunengus sp. YC64 TaxID=3367700 RepID=UPI0040272EEC
MIFKIKLETPGIFLPNYVAEKIHNQEENTMEQFLNRHKDTIYGVISGFDRVLFRGTLCSISYVEGMRAFLSSHHILLKDFGDFVLKKSNQIKECAEAFARHRARPFQYVASPSKSKEEIAKAIMQRDSIADGLICVLYCVEPCQSYAIQKDKEIEKLKLIPAVRKCLHFYFYFIDREFGFMHVRLQSWFPCSIQVCMNGREWLARKMAESMLSRNWHRLLDQFGQRFNPLLQPHSGLDLHGYYWTIRQAEYATDVIFKDAASLKKLYPRLIHHAIEHFSSEDVMRFLQRRCNTRFSGEVISTISKRVEGVRIKHWVEENSIKMYDKQGCVLRIETTINNPRRFKVYREVERKGQKQKAWIPMRKGVSDIYRHAEISLAANARYIDALSVIGEEEPSFQLMDAVSNSISKNNRRYRALRPITSDEARLFQAVLHGEFLLHGFRNENICAILFPSNTTEEERHRNVARTSRLISLLRAHGLIKKVPKTRLYRITQKGHLVMSTSLLFRTTSISLLQKAA